MNEFWRLPVIHSQLHTFTHGRELQRETEASVDLCFGNLNQAHKTHLNMYLSYLDLEIDDLIPLWICVFLNDFGAQLKTKKTPLHINNIHAVRKLKNFIFFLVKHEIPSCQQS